MTVKRFVRLLSLTSVMALPMITIADDDAKQKNDQDAKSQQASTDEKGEGKNAEQNEANRFDRMINKLSQRVDLTSDQKGKIKSALYAQDSELKSAWNEFAEANMQMIQMQAELVAAMDDTLEPQQRKMMEDRRKNRSSQSESDSNSDSQQSSASSSSKEQATSPSQSSQKQNAQNQSSKNQDGNKDNDGSNKKDESQDAQQARNGDQQSQSEKSQSQKSQSQKSAGSSNADEHERVVWTMVVVPIQREYLVAKLSDDQNQKCDQLCQSYRKEMVKLQRKIDKLHHDLVTIEAQRIRQIESTLTAEQLEKLKENRKSPDSEQLSSTQTKSNDR